MRKNDWHAKFEDNAAQHGTQSSMCCMAALTMFVMVF